MTARRRAHKVTALAAVTAAFASLLSGCSLLPGTAEAGDDPITVMTWAPDKTKATNMPGMPAMAEAYARWVNAEGGINGRRLEVLTCNDHNDTVKAARCASRAVKEDAVAVVGSYSQHGRSFMSPLEGARIPYIGGYGLADEEFTSPLSYPVNGGLPALVAGNGRQLAAGECGRVSLVRPDTTAGDQLPPLLNSGLRDGGAAGAAPVSDIRAPEDATSYRTAAQQALEGAAGGSAVGSGGAGGGACITAVLGGRTDTFFDSFRRIQGNDPQIRTASVLGSVRQSLVDRTGGADSPLDGTYATGWYPGADDPRWNPMKKVVREHAFKDNRIDTADPGVQTTWIAYTVLRTALESLDDGAAVTTESLRKTLDEGRPIPTGGLTPDLRWHYEDLLAAHDFPRIVNTQVTYQRVRQGRVVSVRKGFVDVEESLEAGREDSVTDN
ncbi:ABC transporter substrate-binding protein [Streptomyces sp. N2-109]|uniref:ABC transporter substrate-binding protein n=1 Tax=Streptomyces gossypii TaxID=2883101 RepID=A0ABT2JZA8_9ACTN|nr:ABC transporter substrate-binding protein [Streptomyces gossypii]MCT2592660.1 ABC transporter substrate-binding protein [Streptomyces gossypii]